MPQDILQTPGRTQPAGLTDTGKEQVNKLSKIQAPHILYINKQVRVQLRCNHRYKTKGSQTPNGGKICSITVIYFLAKHVSRSFSCTMSTWLLTVVHVCIQIVFAY